MSGFNILCIVLAVVIALPIALALIGRLLFWVFIGVVALGNYIKQKLKRSKK